MHINCGNFPRAWIFLQLAVRGREWSSSEAHANVWGISEGRARSRGFPGRPGLCALPCPGSAGQLARSKHRPTPLQKEEHRVLFSLAPGLTPRPSGTCPKLVDSSAAQGKNQALGDSRVSVPVRWGWRQGEGVPPTASTLTQPKHD